jgi:hypothetical protein
MREQFINLIHQDMDEENVNEEEVELSGNSVEFNSIKIFNSIYKNRTDAVSLYVFFRILSDAKEDDSEKNKIKATTKYSCKFLGWTKQRFIRAKKLLYMMGLVEDVVEKDKFGKISGHYLLMK